MSSRESRRAARRCPTPFLLVSHGQAGCAWITSFSVSDASGFVSRRTRVSALEYARRANCLAAGDLFQKRIGVLRSLFAQPGGASLKNRAQPFAVRDARALCFLEQLVKEAQIRRDVGRLCETSSETAMQILVASGLITQLRYTRGAPNIVYVA